MEAENVFLQNKVIGNNHLQWLPSYRYKAWYKAKNRLTIGRKVTPKTDEGDHIIKPSGDITVYAGQEVNLKPGFQSNYGSNFHAYIQEDCDPRDGNKSALVDNNNNSEIKEEEFTDEYLNSSNNIKTQDLVIYPNPSSDIVTIQFPKYTNCAIRIVNLLGIIIREDSIITEKQISLSLNKGIYFIQVTMDGNSITKQIIVL